jgi:hypothetical protein
MAIAGAAGGDKLASTFLGLAQTTRLMGGDVSKLTERFEKKFGDVANARMRSLSMQFLKFKENIAFIFSGADIEPFLKGLQSVLSIFNLNEDAAKSMRAVVTSFVERAIGGFLRLAIFLVRAYIAIRTNETAWKILGLAVRGVGIVVMILAGTAAVALAAVGIAAGAATLAVGAIGAAIGFVVDQFKWLYSNFEEFKSALTTEGIGSAMVNGIVDGIKKAGRAVYDTLRNVVSEAVKGVKGFLRINSPSGLLRDDVGFQAGMGIARGHRDVEPVVYASGRSMAEASFEGSRSVRAAPPALISLPSPTPMRSERPESDSKSVSFTNCTFFDTSEASVRKVWTSILEGEMFAGAEPA